MQINRTLLTIGLNEKKSSVYKYSYKVRHRLNCVTVVQLLFIVQVFDKNNSVSYWNLKDRNIDLLHNAHVFTEVSDKKKYRPSE